MVLRLSTALDVPLRHSNGLLLAAGYAPVWAETDLGAQILAPIRSALNYILTQQEPFPAVVVDRRWNLQTPPRRSDRNGVCLGKLKVVAGVGFKSPRSINAGLGQNPPGSCLYIDMSGGADASGFGSGRSVIVASVNSSTLATETAFSRAIRTTLVGSMMPASIRSP